ncbi:MAG TPA: Crp/Fnr family transcriptional regulator [Methylomirabilota bacterium]|nr:Crp/Fnr family transcriptional regulator [Methylomirabilota bacterium]
MAAVANADSAELTRNRLLAKLPPRDRARLAKEIEIRPLALRDVLYEPDEPISTVFFPLSGVMSIVIDLTGTTPVEVATVGNEGLIGVPVFLGASSIPMRSFAQIAGHAACLKATAFRREIDSGGPLRNLVQRYTQALMHQVAQAVACNARHVIQQRCARWLLMTADRVESDSFALTQDFLAQMLGVRRAGVTAAARSLQSEGIIDYHRGQITIKDRRKLELASCECYRKVQEEYERLLG